MIVDFFVFLFFFLYSALRWIILVGNQKHNIEKPSSKMKTQWIVFAVLKLSAFLCLINLTTVKHSSLPWRALTCISKSLSVITSYKVTFLSFQLVCKRWAELQFSVRIRVISLVFDTLFNPLTPGYAVEIICRPLWGGCQLCYYGSVFNNKIRANGSQRSWDRKNSSLGRRPLWGDDR